MFQVGQQQIISRTPCCPLLGAQPALGVECSRFVYRLLILTTVENKAAWRWEVAQ